MHTALLNSYQIGESQYTTDVIHLLLKMGARCDVKNRNGSTAVEYAASTPSCSLDTFTVLLQACSDMDAIKRCLWTLCSQRDKDETVQFIRALQRFGVSLEDRDKNGVTVLLSHTVPKGLLGAFIECGADIHAVDPKGRGLLHCYVASRNNSARDVVQRLVDLVDMGLDPMQVST